MPPADSIPWKCAALTCICPPELWTGYPAPPRPVLGGTAQVLCPHSLLWLQVLHDYQRYRSNIREIGDLWVGLGTVPRHRGCAEGSIWGVSALSLGLRWRLSTRL